MFFRGVNGKKLDIPSKTLGSLSETFRLDLLQRLCEKSGPVFCYVVFIGFSVCAPTENFICFRAKSELCPYKVKLSSDTIGEHCEQISLHVAPNPNAPALKRNTGCKHRIKSNTIG